MYGAVKFKNEIEKCNLKYGHNILLLVKNKRINGANCGFYGHILDVRSGICVYVSFNVGTQIAMYRLAKDTNDWSSNGIKGGFNRYCNLNELPKEVLKLILSEKIRMISE